MNKKDAVAKRLLPDSDKRKIDKALPPKTPRPVKLNDGYYHEALDRIHCLQIYIEHILLEHPVIQRNDKWQKQILQATKLLGNVYQEVGNASP